MRKGEKRNSAVPTGSKGSPNERMGIRSITLRPYGVLNVVVPKDHSNLIARLDRLFDEKIDGNLEEDFYTRKLAQYSEEKESILKSIKSHSDSSDNYRNKSLQIYEISQDATNSYLKGTPDQKHELMNLVFEKLTITNGKLEYKYTPDFDRLFQAVQGTNSSKDSDNTSEDTIIFELGKKTDKSNINGRILPTRPDWLLRQGSNLGHPP